MSIDVEVGDRFLLRYFPSHERLREVEVTIYYIDEDSLLIYSDEAASKGLGHFTAYLDGDWVKYSLPEPDNRYGSWWTTKLSLEKLIITKLPKEELFTLHPNWKVICKIKEIEARRRKMGYKYV